jgi:hypothetical protein
MQAEIRRDALALAAALAKRLTTRPLSFRACVGTDAFVRPRDGEAGRGEGAIPTAQALKCLPADEGVRGYTIVA